jgi:hypothetical protein
MKYKKSPKAVIEGRHPFYENTPEAEMKKVWFKTQFTIVLNGKDVEALYYASLSHVDITHTVVAKLKTRYTYLIKEGLVVIDVTGKPKLTHHGKSVLAMLDKNCLPPADEETEQQP